MSSERTVAAAEYDQWKEDVDNRRSLEKYGYLALKAIENYRDEMHWNADVKAGRLVDYCPEDELTSSVVPFTVEALEEFLDQEIVEKRSNGDLYSVDWVDEYDEMDLVLEYLKQEYISYNEG